MRLSTEKEELPEPDAAGDGAAGREPPMGEISSVVSSRPGPSGKSNSKVWMGLEASLAPDECRVRADRVSRCRRRLPSGCWPVKACLIRIRPLRWGEPRLERTQGYVGHKLAGSVVSFTSQMESPVKLMSCG